MIQNQENGEKSHLGPDLDLLGSASANYFFENVWFPQSLYIIVS